MAVLTETERMIVDTVHEFVDRDVRPVVQQIEHADEYPEKMIEQMKELGIFGLAIPEELGGTKVSMPCYVHVTEELARGWMSLAGAMGGHTVVAKLLVEFGTDEQKATYLPRMATGEVRATMALTEPGGGSDLQAMRTVAVRDGDHYVVNGSKTWITNARRSGLIALMCKTDPAASPRHRGISILLVEHGPGLTVSKDLPKLGYKGVESCELIFEDCRVPVSALLGGSEGRGFPQMMRGTGDRSHPGRLPRPRRRQSRLRGCAAVRPGPGVVRQADLAAPVDRQLPRRHGDQADRRPPAHPVRRRALRAGRALRPRGGHGEAVRLRGGDGDRPRTPSGSTAGTATPPSSTSSATSVTRR